MDINDLEKKYGNLGKSSGKYDISDAKNKLEDLINDEDLKEALRKMKKNQKKKAMLLLVLLKIQKYQILKRYNMI